MMIEMEIRELQRSDAIPSQIVVLEEKDGPRRFPIYIGPAEAFALENAMTGREALRPMTHDLVSNVIDGLGAELVGIYVDELKDDVFHGKLLLKTADNDRVMIDTRPSDAMVMAMKKGVPVWVHQDILDSMPSADDDEEGEDEDPDSDDE